MPGACIYSTTRIALTALADATSSPSIPTPRHLQQLKAEVRELSAQQCAYNHWQEFGFGQVLPKEF